MSEHGQEHGQGLHPCGSLGDYAIQARRVPDLAVGITGGITTSAGFGGVRSEARIADGRIPSGSPVSRDGVVHQIKLYRPNFWVTSEHVVHGS